MDMMGKAGILFLLLPVLLCAADTDPDPSHTETYSATPEEHSSSSSSSGGTPVQPSAAITASAGGPEVPRGDCLIDTEMGLIAVGSAGGLIVCLLLTVLALACQVCHLQRRAHMPRSSRSNMNLASAAGHWATDGAESGGVVGPCDNSVMLEEVNTEAAERSAETQGGPGREDGSAGKQQLPEEEVPLMPSSGSRDSCSEVPKDLENMPLVV